MAETLIPSYVRAFAGKHRVPLAEISPPADGVMTCLDIYEWAKANGKPDLQIAALMAQNEWNSGVVTASPYPAPGRPRRSSGTVSEYEAKRASLNAMGRNPLVDQVRASASALGKPTPAGSSPTLFATGDTPAFCASGIPPESVLDVPWQARHAVASAPTAGEALRITAECSGSDAEQTAVMMFGNHPGNVDYADRVEQWRVESLSDDQVAVDGTSAGSEERQRRATALGDQPLPEEDEAMIAAAAQRLR